MKCDLFIENFDADDARSPALTEEMRIHMRDCPECAAYVENAKNIRAQLNALGEEDVPVFFIDSMKAAVEKEKVNSRKQRKFGWKGIAGLAAAAVVIVGAISIIGWGGGRANSYNSMLSPMTESSSYAGSAMNAAAPQATSSVGYSYEGVAMDESAKLRMAAGEAEIAYDMAVTQEEPYIESPQFAPEPDAGNNAHGLKIIRTGNISLETDQFDTDYQGVQDMITQYGGYIESMSVYGTPYSTAEARGGNRYGSITARIPSSALDAFIESARNTGNVTNISVYSEDVTARYQDTELRLQTLYAQHERLIELIGKATEITDLIALEQKMQEIQYQIDSYTGTLRGWDARVDYSTVYFNISEVKAFTSTEADTLSERMAKALQNSIESVKEMAKSTAVWAAGSVPYLILLAAIGALALIIIACVRSSKKKKTK